MNNKKRLSNIELLRIIAMLFVVMSHYASGLSGSNLKFGTNYYFFCVFRNFGQVGVGIFLLIMGYFMIDQKVTLKRFLRLYLDVIFYSVAVFAVFALWGREYITLKLTLKSFLPILYVNWWYFTAYTIIILLSPWLNKLLKSLENYEYEKLLFVLFSIFTITRFLYKSLVDSDVSGFVYGWLIPCFNLYVLGAYLKLHMFEKLGGGGTGKPVSTQQTKNLSRIRRIIGTQGDIKKNKLLTAAGLILYIGLIISVLWVGHFVGSERLMSKYTYFSSLESPFVVFIAYEMFLVALKAKPFVNPFINKIASSTFGIYLIHTHSLVKGWLFPVLLRNTELYQTKWFIPGAIASVMGVFIVCSIIDLTRQKLLDGVKEKLINKIVSVYEGSRLAEYLLLDEKRV